MCNLEPIREIDVHPGPVEVVAYQETLLLMAVFGIVILAMVWAGFRKWLQHKENMSRFIAEQAPELSLQYRAQMERMEARLNAIEQIGPAGGEPIESPSTELNRNEGRVRVRQ